VLTGKKNSAKGSVGLFFGGRQGEIKAVQLHLVKFGLSRREGGEYPEQELRFF
jgi:hypothetical protein